MRIFVAILLSEEMKKSVVGTMHELKKAGVNGRYVPAQVPYDRKKFVPHITIIRNMGGPWKKVAAPKGKMMVQKLSLMKSEQKEGKSLLHLRASGPEEYPNP